MPNKPIKQARVQVFTNYQSWMDTENDFFKGIAYREGKPRIHSPWIRNPSNKWMPWYDMWIYIVEM